jgi:hypothetical protein
MPLDSATFWRYILVGVRLSGSRPQLEITSLSVWRRSTRLQRPGYGCWQATVLKYTAGPWLDRVRAESLDLQRYSRGIGGLRTAEGQSPGRQPVPGPDRGLRGGERSPVQASASGNTAIIAAVFVPKANANCLIGEGHENRSERLCSWRSGHRKRHPKRQRTWRTMGPSDDKKHR